MTTSPRSVKTALAALFNADAAMTTVTFHEAAVPETDLIPDYVVLGNVSGSDDPLTMGGGVWTVYNIECDSRFKGVTSAAAFDRAWAVKDAIVEVLAVNHTASDNVMDVNLTGWEITETVDPDDGRVAALEFTLEVKDRN